MKTETFEFPDNGWDTTEYLKNPVVVTYDEDEDGNVPVGTATIDQANATVTVTFFDEVPSWDHTIGVEGHAGLEDPEFVQLANIAIVRHWSRGEAP